MLSLGRTAASGKWMTAAALAACGAVLCVHTAAALEILGYSSARHDRFSAGYPSAPVPSLTWFAHDVDWSGVGWDAGTPSRSVALISPRHFVCATHHRPGSGARIDFLNHLGVIESRTVQSMQATTTWGGNSDLTVGTLSSPLSNQVACYAVVFDSDLNWYRGQQLLVYGWTAKAGRNELVSFSASAFASTFTAYFTFDEEDGLGIDECRFQSNDSGSPTFIMRGDRLFITGVHTGRSTDNLKHYDTFVPYYTDQVSTILSDDGYSLQIMPSATLSTAEASPTSASPIPITIEFGLGVTGFAAADLLVTNGSAANLQTSDNAVFTVDITPGASGTVTVELPEGAAQSQDGGWGNAAALPLQLVYENPSDAWDFDVDQDGCRNFRDLCFASRSLAGAPLLQGNETLPPGEDAATIQARIDALLVIRPDGFAPLDVDLDSDVDAWDLERLKQGMFLHPGAPAGAPDLPQGVTQEDVDSRTDLLLGR